MGGNLKSTISFCSSFLAAFSICIFIGCDENSATTGTEIVAAKNQQTCLLNDCNPTENNGQVDQHDPVSEVNNQNITLLTPTVTLNDGALKTNSTEIFINVLDSAGATEIYLTDTEGCSIGGIWMPVAPSIPWTLKMKNERNHVFAIFRNFNTKATSNCIDLSIEHDDIGPETVEFRINNGASATTSTLVDIKIVEPIEAKEVYLTNTKGCEQGGNWVSFASKIFKWTLAQQNSLATVYMKIKDSDNNESNCFSQNIEHDSVAPSGGLLLINNDDIYTKTKSVNLTLAAVGASLMYITNTSGCTSGGLWQNFNTISSWNLGLSNTASSVYVKFKDQAGNESSCVSDSIIHDDQAPSQPTIVINNDAIYTSISEVTLTISATSAKMMFIANDITNCIIGASWENYSTSKVWTLGTLNSTSNVYIKFRDDAGNESPCVTDSIVHDNIAPEITLSSSNASTTILSDTDNTTFTRFTVFNGSAFYEYRLDGGSWVLSTSQYYDVNVPYGIHTIEARATDYAGNVSNTKSYTWTVQSLYYLTTVSGNTVIKPRDSTIGTIWLSTIFAEDTWNNSSTGCSNLTYAGYSDWYLPSKDYLEGFIANGIRHFISGISYDLWTSTNYPTSGYKYIVNLGTETTSYRYANTIQTANIICFRIGT